MLACMPKLMVLMRVKDGMLFLDRWLASVERLVDEIIIVDNGSTDGTLERLRQHPKVVSIDQTVGYHHGRDDNLMLQRAKARGADWLLYLDVDEVFEDRVNRHRLDKMMASPRVNQYWFRRFHLHLDENHFEGSMKKLWEIAKPDRLLWRNRPSVYFPNEMMHVFPRGFDGKSKTSPLRIRHFGAVVSRDYYVKKMNTYLEIDPGRSAMYLEHRDHQLPTCVWHEFADRPILVQAQLLMLDSFLIMRFALQKFRGARRRLGVLLGAINPLRSRPRTKNDLGQ